MTADLERALAAVDFDAEADAPRSGWNESADHRGLKLWTRQEAGLYGVVTGLSGDTDGAGCWWFAVEQDGQVLTFGESSRRGWAMDGADAAFPVVN